MPKKKKKSGTGKGMKCPPTAVEERTNIGVCGNVNASVENIIVGSHVGDINIHIHQHGSAMSLPYGNRELMNMIRTLIHSNSGGRYPVPIETLTDLFHKENQATFKDASGGKRMISFIREHDKDFILEESRNGNWKVSVPEKQCKSTTPNSPNPSSVDSSCASTPTFAPPHLPLPRQPVCIDPRPFDGMSPSSTQGRIPPRSLSTEFGMQELPEPSSMHLQLPRSQSDHSCMGGPGPQPEPEAFPDGRSTFPPARVQLPSAGMRPEDSIGRDSSARSRIPSSSSPSSSPRKCDIPEASAAHSDMDSELPVLQNDPLGFDASVDTVFQKANDFKLGHFVLITGELPRYVSDLDGISSIPWQLVFDFDEKSRDDGLLSCVEGVLETRRSLHISDWTDSPTAIRNNSTIWYFPRGRREKPDTRLTTYKEWRKKVQARLDVLLRDLSGFVYGCSVLTVIVLWNEDIGKFLNHLTCKLCEELKDSVNVIVCIDANANAGDVCSYKYLSVLEDEIDMTRVSVQFRKLISAFADRVQVNPTVVASEFKLPTFDKTNNPDIDVVLASHLAEDLDVLYLTNPSPEREPPDLDKLRSEVRNFLKGDTLSWATWYSCDANPFDVKRDIHMEVLSTIQRHLQKDSWKSTTFTLHHAPGSGGTTLSQRILWELKDHFPCVQVHLARGPARDVASKIEKLYSLTHLPVICLLDGEDEPKVKQLQRYLKDGTYIIFSVQRSSKALKPGSGFHKGTRHYWLQGYLSKAEAPQMAMKYEQFCEEVQKQALSKLCRDVTDDRKPHHLYEFGLTAFLHEFKGIQSLVKGYLQLGASEGVDLTTDQKVLAFLSLVYYYGQTAVPCHFFSGILGKEKNEYMCIDDFSDEVRQLIVEEDDCGVNVRICHHLIAQEILEQVLTRGHAREPRRETLSVSARRQLHKLAIDFIEYASEETNAVYRANCKSPIAIILTRTFIFRDNKDTGQLDTDNQRRKPVLGRLLTDIEVSPPYEERLLVLQALTTKFPQEPNFFAHLGRFYSRYRPNEEKEAEDAFEEALSICHNMVGGDLESIDPTSIDESLRVTLMHIYHMFATVYCRRVGKYTGRYFGSKPEIQTSEEEFKNRVHELLKMTEIACDLFKRDRDITPHGQEDSYGYYGEICVRLQVCDFIHRTNPLKKNLGQYATSKATDLEVKNFVKESIMIIDELFLECYSVVNADNLDGEFKGLLYWHNALFGKEAGLERVYGRLSLDDDIETRRLKVAAKKLKYSNKQNLSVIENITLERDVEEIVKYFEANFDDVLNKGRYSRKKLLDNDHREWLIAIRHPHFTKVYSLPAVLKQVKEWYEFLKTPFAAFYVFIVHSMLGFGENFRRGSTENLAIAVQMMEDLQKHRRSIMRPRHPREWLGKGGRGFKRLVPGSRFLGHIEGRTIAQNSTSRDVLATCKGTICKPNRSSASGFISMDLGDNYINVVVFFIPSKSNLTGEFYVERRVEFVLGFSIDHGYEAFNVLLLTRVQCGHCSHKMELRDSETLIICSMCHHKIARIATRAVQDSS